MEEFSDDEVRELLIGTWTAIALIAEALIERAFVPRDELLEAMQTAQALARDRRRTAIAGVQMLIEEFGRPR